MTWSLMLRNGDLFHDKGHYATVQGPAKLVQDLRCWILERMGNDDLHPELGSVIDGGRLADGTQVPSAIGSVDFSQVAMDIETEIRRIEDEYQARQNSRLEDDVRIYGRPTLRQDEILAEISNIAFSQIQDTLVVQITVIPLTAQPEILAIPVSVA